MKEFHNQFLQLAERQPAMNAIINEDWTRGVPV